MDELLQTCDMILTDKCAVQNSEFWSNSKAIFFLQTAVFSPFWLFTLYTVPGRQKTNQHPVISVLPIHGIGKVLTQFVKSALQNKDSSCAQATHVQSANSHSKCWMKKLISLLLPIQQTIQLCKNKPQKFRVYTTDRVLLQSIPR